MSVGAAAVADPSTDATADAAPATVTVDLASAALSRVTDAVEAAAKLADKIGVPGPTITSNGPGKTIVIPAPEPYSDWEELATVISTTNVTVTVPTADSLALPGGWHLVGTVDTDDDPVIVNTVPGIEVDTSGWRDASAVRCDHCNRAIASRKKLIAVRSADGDIMLVGTTCAKDFLGVKDPVALAKWLDGLAMLTLVDSYDEDGFYGGGASASARPSLVGVVAVATAVVNTIGWVGTTRFIEEESAYWRKVIAINLESVLYVTHPVLERMIARKQGTICNIASDAGRVGTSGEAVYSACKAGVIALCNSLARENARYNINVNAIAPGPTDTPLLQAEIEENPDLIQRMTRLIPFRKVARPEDQAGAISYLVSDDAAYVTGQVISVSGGLTMVD